MSDDDRAERVRKIAKVSEVGILFSFFAYVFTKQNGKTEQLLARMKQE